MQPQSTKLEGVTAKDHAWFELRGKLYPAQRVIGGYRDFFNFGYEAAQRDAEEEILRLKTALSDMIKVAEFEQWDDATTGKHIILKFAKDALSTASPSNTE